MIVKEIDQCLNQVTKWLSGQALLQCIQLNLPTQQFVFQFKLNQ